MICKFYRGKQVGWFYWNKVAKASIECLNSVTRRSGEGVGGGRAATVECERRYATTPGNDLPIPALKRRAKLRSTLRVAVVMIHAMRRGCDDRRYASRL